MRSASPTEVPPNFCTTTAIPMTLMAPGGPFGPLAPHVSKRAVPGQIGSRAVPSEKRARQRAGREMRLAEQAKAKKRRKQTRNGIILAVIVLVIVLIVVLTTGGSPKKSASTTTTTTAPKTTTTTVAGSTTTTVPPTIAAIPAADLSPAGTAGKAPTAVVPAGSPPTPLESADLITGTGAAAKTGDALTVQYVLATYSS